MDGFTISGGNADYRGGGMLNDSGSPTLTHVNFSGNFTSENGDGGGMYNSFSSPIDQCHLFLAQLC